MGLSAQTTCLIVAQKKHQGNPHNGRSPEQITQPAMELNINKLKKILALTSLLIFNGCSLAKMETIDTHKIELEVLDAFKGLVKASEALDAKKYLEYYDREKFSGLNADGTVWRSIEDLERLIISGFPAVEKITSLEFKNVKVTIIDSSTAILINEYTQSLQLKNGNIAHQSGGGTQVWHITKGAWKLVSVSASEIPKLD